jgi:hypothetical protein
MELIGVQLRGKCTLKHQKRELKTPECITGMTGVMMFRARSCELWCLKFAGKGLENGAGAFPVCRKGARGAWKGWGLFIQEMGHGDE